MRRSRTSEVPLAEMDAARTSAEAMFPGLVAHVAWTPGSAQSDICVEFKLDSGGRRVIPWAHGRPA